jgi:hypothetical protein
MSISNRLMLWWIALTGRSRDERGDVPGWVMITVMTAALVSAIWLIAEDQLKSLLTDALDSVSSN